MKTNEEFCADILAKETEYLSRKKRNKRILFGALSCCAVIVAVFGVRGLTDLNANGKVPSELPTAKETVAEYESTDAFVMPEESTVFVETDAHVDEDIAEVQTDSVVPSEPTAPVSQTDNTSSGFIPAAPVAGAPRQNDPNASGNFQSGNIWCLRDGESADSVQFKTVIDSSDVVSPACEAPCAGTVCLSAALQKELRAHAGDPNVIYHAAITVYGLPAGVSVPDFLASECDRIFNAISGQPWGAACLIGVNTFTDHGVSVHTLFTIASEELFASFPADPAYGYYISLVNE